MTGVRDRKGLVDAFLRHLSLGTPSRSRHYLLLRMDGEKAVDHLKDFLKDFNQLVFTASLDLEAVGAKVQHRAGPDSTWRAACRCMVVSPALLRGWF